MTTNASPPPILQSNAIHAFLKVLALSIRNICDADAGRDLLDRLEGKAAGFLHHQVAEKFNLSRDDVANVFHLIRILRKYWMGKDVLIVQKTDASPPPILQSNAVHVFLKILALSIRNIYEANVGLDLLDRLEGKAEGSPSHQKVAEEFNLSRDDIANVFHLIRLLRRSWSIGKDVLIAQKQEGPPH